VLKCRKILRREIGETVRYLPHTKKNKFRLPVKSSLLRGSYPKYTGASPKHFAHSIPDFIQIGSPSTA